MFTLSSNSSNLTVILISRVQVSSMYSIPAYRQAKLSNTTQAHRRIPLLPPPPPSMSTVLSCSGVGASRNLARPAAMGESGAQVRRQSSHRPIPIVTNSSTLEFHRF